MNNETIYQEQIDILELINRRVLQLKEVIGNKEKFDIIFTDTEDIFNIYFACSSSFISVLQQEYSLLCFQQNSRKLLEYCHEAEKVNDIDKVHRVLDQLSDEVKKAIDEILMVLEGKNINYGDLELVSRNRVTGNKKFNKERMNDLEKYFFYEKHNIMEKWYQYFEIYEIYFKKYRNKPVTIMEIGVFGGGSLQMWKKYFGDRCRIIGVDIAEDCKKFEEDQIEIYIGSQDDRNFLRKLKDEIPKIDILIDDGGHFMNQQIITFEELFEWIDINGVYLCEDVHTSYFERYNGGLGKDSYINYTKGLIDKMHAWYTSGKLPVDKYTRSIQAIHYYDSVVVIEKRDKKMPKEVMVEDGKMVAEISCVGESFVLEDIYEDKS